MKYRKFTITRTEDNLKAKPPVLYDLAVYVISWGRPALLDKTLSSIFAQSAEMNYCVNLVDNGSGPEVKQVIAKYLPRLHRVYCHTTNLGVSKGWESILYPIPEAKYLMFSDGDMQNKESFNKYIDFLIKNKIDACGGQHSPEHSVISNIKENKDVWLIKRQERGCHIVISSDKLYKMRPFGVPAGVKIAWDDYIMSKIFNFGVLVGGATHLGAKDSTWQTETPEYTELEIEGFKVQ